MTILKGNYFNQSYSLTGNTVIEGGNFILCRVVTNGFSLDIHGGNVRGLYIDGVKQDGFVARFYDGLPVAKNMLADAKARAGEDGVNALVRGFFEQVVNAPSTVTFQQVAPAYESWRLANGNMISWDMLFSFLAGYFPVGWAWTDIRDYIQKYDLATWSGESTQLVAEYE